MTALTRAELELEHPHLYAQIVADLKVEATAAGAAAEIARIRGVFQEAAEFPHAAKLARHIALETNGTAADLAQAILALQRQGVQAQARLAGALSGTGPVGASA